MRDPKRTLIDRDQLMNSDKTTVARATVRLFDTLQTFYEKPHEQLMALAATFVLMAEACRFDPYDAYTAVKRLMVDEIHSERRDHRFAAMAYHLREDILQGNPA